MRTIIVLILGGGVETKADLTFGPYIDLSDCTCSCMVSHTVCVDVWKHALGAWLVPGVLFWRKALLRCLGRLEGVVMVFEHTG